MVAAEQPSSTVTVVAEVVVESSAVEVGNDTTAPVAPVNGSANAPLSPQQAISEADAAIAEADAALAEV